MTTLCNQCYYGEDCRFATRPFPREIDDWDLSNVGIKCQKRYELVEGEKHVPDVYIYVGGD